jgi:hypothetical protein
MQVFISYRDFSGPLIPFAIALFIQFDLNHRNPFSRPISQVFFNRPLSIALNLMSRLIVLLQFLRVFDRISHQLQSVLIVEPLMGLCGEVKGNDHASGHLEISSLIEPETIDIRQ